MKRKTGKTIYCPTCYRAWSEHQNYPDNLDCKGCISTIEELRDIKSKRVSGTRIPKGKIK
jgi:hypothetical protein